ncbi:MAG: hypothetical protein MJ245_06555 [Clostridia bacterium]|nr:hypothetical protein [Clostridia bacterium]
MKISKILILSAAALSLAACGEHTHSFGDVWKSDDTSHWHECECGEKSDKADHLDTNTDGKCDVCNHDMEVPTPTGTQVTQAEWEAAFGLEKPYKIAENYKIDMETISENELKIGSSYRSLSVDGLKARKVRTKNAEEHDIEYTLKTQNGFTSYFWNESQQKWEINEEAGDPTNEFASFLTPFGTNFDKFNFDDSSKSYKCLTLDVGGTICTNMSIKFENKKIVSASLESAWKMGTDLVNYHWQSTITYGGQTVTLPENDPEPSGEEYKVTENQFNAAFTLEGLNNVTITTSSGSFSQKCEADGTKEFNVNMKSYDFYLNKENGVMYEYKQEDGKWVKNQKEGTTYSREDLIGMFGNVYNQLTYDDDSNSYKGTNISIGGAVRYSEVEYCFENLKVVAINVIVATGSAAGQSMTVTFTKYGQTVVNLPKIDPEPAQGMTEDEFNALVNTVNNVGLTILAKNTPMVEGVQIPEASSHTTYKYNVENEAYYLCTVDSDGSISESKVVNQVSYYSHNGEPYQVRDLTPEQAHNSFIEIREEAMAALLPSTDFSDYEYDSINDNYRLEISFEYDGIAVEEVLFYEMNADGITSVKGTSTATFEGRTMDSFLEVKNIVLGPQEIIA